MLFGVFGIPLSAQSNLQFTSSCGSIFINACSAELVTLTASATTDCANGTSLIFNYQIDENNDGSIDMSGSSNEVSDTFSLGEHRIIFTVIDECNDTLTCEYIFTLEDTEPPVPICINGLATAIMLPSGMLNLSASDFESGSSFDNCTSYQNLNFSFSSDINDDTLLVNCSMIISSNIIPLEIWVTDEAGNQDYCITYVVIQDPNYACIVDPPLSTGIFANTTEGVELCDFDVCVNNVDCYSIHSVGPFSLFAVLEDGDLISLNKEDDPLNGVTTFDKVLMARHILGVQPFTSLFDSLAADVNQSSTITTLDLVLIQSVILQINTEFPNGKSWVSSPAELVYNSFDNHEFTAVKLGDLNGSASPNTGCLHDGGYPSETRNLDESLQLFTSNQFLEKGKSYTIPIYAENFQDLLGGQFTLNFVNDKISIEEVLTGELDALNKESFGLTQLNEGTLLCSWTKGLAESLDASKPLFELKITATENTALRQVLEINSSTLKAEAYKEIESGYGFLDIQFDVLEKVTEGVEVIPNPFTNFTNISFTNSAVGQVELNVFDLSGKRIFSQQKNMDKGFQKIRIEKIHLPSKGIYFYEIKTKNKVYSGKIIQQ